MTQRVHKKSETCYVVQLADGKVYTAYAETNDGKPFVHTATACRGPAGKYFKQYHLDHHSKLLGRLTAAILAA